MKIVDLPKDPARAAAEKLRRDMDTIREQQALLARIRYITYRAHVEAGFTPDEAMQIVTAGMMQ